MLGIFAKIAALTLPINVGVIVSQFSTDLSCFAFGITLAVFMAVELE